MSELGLLEFFTQISFVVLGAATFLDYLRHRDQTRRDIMLMVNSIGLVTALQLFTMVTGLDSLWLRMIAVFALVSQPYLLLRLVRYFKNIHIAISSSVTVGMAACFALTAYIVNVDSTPSYLVIVVIAYFVVFNVYAMAAFIRGAFTTAGVVRQRLRLGAIGSGLFALALFIAGFNSIVPALETITDPLYRLIAMTSALAYYAGFVPPRWLRRMWQLSELREYLLLIGKPGTNRISEAEHIRQLMRTSQSSVSAMGALVASPNEVGQEWKTLYSNSIPKVEQLDLENSVLVGKTWNDRVPAFSRRSSQLADGDLQLLDFMNARTLLSVPIDSGESRWGLLLVFLRHDSLFIEDDLELLELIAQQSAIVIENSTLIDALQASNEYLEQGVEERTLELRLAFDQIRKLNSDLEDRVAERTAQLTAVNKELEAFTYSVSHDLRAPLRAIDGFSEALREDYSGKLGSEAENYLLRIRSGSQRMGQLIDDLLQLSRLSRADLQRMDFDISEIACLLGEEAKSQWPSHSVEFVVQDGLTANGDVRFVRAALSNLLDNAWKFSTKQECPHVEFGSTRHNGQQAFFVRDNGAGFDMAYYGKMFGAFQRLHSDYEFKGTGIGLATVRRIVNRHGGEVWAEGETGKGATFYFTLSSNGVK